MLVFVLVFITFWPFSFCNHVDEEERAGCFSFIIFQMSCYCKCFVALPHGAVGWSAVCDCGFPDHTLFFIHPNLSPFFQTDLGARLAKMYYYFFLLCASSILS